MGFVAKPEHAIAALTRDLDGRLASTDRGVLRASEDAYRQVIGQVTAQGLEGEFTRRTAAQAALNTFADRGITGFVDTAGKKWGLPEYTEMATRTAALNASRAGRLDSMRAAGNDLAIISTSPSACPSCAEWEGEIISLDGVTPGYPTLAEAEGSGHLFGPNCGHMADPYVEGVTVDTSAPSDPAMYEARQTQRGMERSIRQWKTRGAVALDDKTAALAKSKVSEWQDKLREYVATNDLKRLSYREQIPALRVATETPGVRAVTEIAPSGRVLFTEAQTLDEATSALARITGMGPGKVQFFDQKPPGWKGTWGAKISEKRQLASANNMLRELDDMFTRFPNLPRNAVANWVNTGGSSGRAYMAVRSNMGRNGLTWAEKELGPLQREVWLEWEAKHPGQPFHAGGLDNWRRNVVRHEYGHALTTDDTQLAFEVAKAAMEKRLMAELGIKDYGGRLEAKWVTYYQRHISAYKPGDRFEQLAETFTFYTDRSYVRGSLPQEIERFFDSMVNGRFNPRKATP